MLCHICTISYLDKLKRCQSVSQHSTFKITWFLPQAVACNTMKGCQVKVKSLQRGQIQCKGGTDLIMGNLTHVRPLAHIFTTLAAKDQQYLAGARHLDILQQPRQCFWGVGRVHQHLEVLLQVNVLSPARHHLCGFNARNYCLQQSNRLSGRERHLKGSVCVRESCTVMHVQRLRHLDSSMFSPGFLIRRGKSNM